LPPGKPGSVVEEDAGMVVGGGHGHGHGHAGYGGGHSGGMMDGKMMMSGFGMGVGAPPMRSDMEVDAW
jgi:hypothetical protein